MQAKAKLSYLRISPRKVRLVADVVRGLDAIEAEKKLSFINKKAARPILKLLQSCIANAENNFKLKKDNLFIKEIRVDEGPTLKRWMPRAMGRASAVNKRTSHINIVLDEKVKTEKLKDKKTDKTKDEKKEDKNVKVVKSLDEVKELGKKDEVKGEDKKLKDQNVVKEIKDVRREGSDRKKQHLDKVHKKGKGGIIKRVFRRKSI